MSSKLGVRAASETIAFCEPAMLRGLFLSTGRSYVKSMTKRTTWLVVEHFSSKLYSKGLPSQLRPLFSMEILAKGPGIV